jgi:hypothetical protein
MDIIQQSKCNVPSSWAMSREAMERERRSIVEQQEYGDKHTLASAFDESHPFQLAVLNFVSKADDCLVVFEREWL